MIIKNAITTLYSKLLDDKTQTIVKQFLMPFILLSTIKSYINKYVTEQEIFVIPKHIRDRAQTNKMVLVLDLDETLIYSRAQTFPNHNNFAVIKDLQGAQYIIQPRPYLRQFLAATSSIFTIYIYTAGRKNYANAALRLIDTQNVVKKRFYRESCVSFNKSFVKDLKKINKSGQKMLLIDDNIDSIRLNSPNSLHILPFQGNQEDKELILIFKKLLDLYNW